MGGVFVDHDLECWIKYTGGTIVSTRPDQPGRTLVVPIGRHFPSPIETHGTPIFYISATPNVHFFFFLDFWYSLYHLVLHSLVLVRVSQVLQPPLSQVLQPLSQVLQPRVSPLARNYSILFHSFNLDIPFSSFEQRLSVHRQINQCLPTPPRVQGLTNMAVACLQLMEIRPSTSSRP